MSERIAATRQKSDATSGLLVADDDGWYLQDTRSYVGNDMIFWAKDDRGYTTDLRKAEVYTREAAFRQHAARNSDLPWPKAYIDSKSRPAVDAQFVRYKDALLSVSFFEYKP